jgi:hypothetical protein
VQLPRSKQPSDHTNDFQDLLDIASFLTVRRADDVVLANPTRP